MKAKNWLLFAICAGMGMTVSAQQEITIKGKVKFVDEGFKMTLFQRMGQSKKILAEVPVNADHTYEMKVSVEKPIEATLDCGHWQSVNVWLEDENLGVDFRGLDTARIKIKNPPYVYIRGGKNNELMNLINFEAYRDYQAMIAAGQSVYFAKIGDEKKAQDLSGKLYDAVGENHNAHMRYFIEHYADRNSVLVAIKRAREADEALIEEALKKLENNSATSKELVADYRKKAAADKEARERMKEGNPAPEFEFQNEKGKKKSLSDYKGKVLVLDFWASWCGPCRQEIPHLKKFYEEFKGKDVEFLSVSIDAKKKDWEKARGEEKMPWPQGWVTDGGKSVMQTYQFGGIPFILVLDKDGNIYKKNLRGVGVKDAVEEALSGKKAEALKTISMGMMGASM